MLLVVRGFQNRLKIGPSWPQLAQVGPKLVQVGTKLTQDGVKLAKVGPKLAQAKQFRPR